MAVRLGRLKRRAEFLRIAKERRKWAAPGLVLQAADGPGKALPPEDGAAGPGLPRVGFTCSKKVGNAVERNRARRRLRAAAAEVLPALAAPALDYVLIGRTETLRRPYAMLLQDLRAALKRVGALKQVAKEPTDS